MKRRHSRSNGFLLNEMLLILALISVLMLLSVEPVRVFFFAVLGSHQAFERQGQVDMLVAQFRRDAENADRAYVLAADERTGGDLLYLAGPHGLVCYQFSDGAAVCAGPEQMRQWDIPQVSFDWRLIPLNGGGQAVTMTTFQRHKRRRDGLPAFRGSYVFVVNLHGQDDAAERQ